MASQVTGEKATGWAGGHEIKVCEACLHVDKPRRADRRTWCHRSACWEGWGVGGTLIACAHASYRLTCLGEIGVFSG